MRERFLAWRPAAALAMAILLAGSTGLSLAGDKHDHSQRGWLGVSLGDGDDGARILSVMADSPAQQAGLQAGDVVVALDGRPVADAGEFMAAFREYEPGESPSLTVRRDGSELTVQPVLAEKSGRFMIDLPRFNFDFGGDMQPKTGRRGYLGVHLQPLTEELREYFGAPADEGILVARVEAGSPAAQAGLQAGDVITGIDGSKVSRHRDLVTGLADLEEGDPVEITAYRDRQAQSFQVNVGVKEFRSSGWSFRCEDDADCEEMEFFPHGGVLRLLEDQGWQEDLKQRLHELEERLQQLQPEKNTSGAQT